MPAPTKTKGGAAFGLWRYGFAFLAHGISGILA